MDEAFLNQIQVAAAVLLKKPITLDQLEKAIGAMKEESGGPGGQVQRITIDGHSALKYTPAADESWDGPQQMLTGISADGKTVVLSINEASLGSELARAGGAPAAAVSPELAAALRTLTEIQAQDATFAGRFLDHPDPTVAREALFGVASAGDLAAIGVIEGRWPEMPASLRQLAADGLISKPATAEAFARRIAAGGFAGGDPAV
jgi:hypothetical protein